MDASRLTDRSLDELVERAVARGRHSVRGRVARVSGKSWHIGQCAVAAGLAWFAAKDLFHHQVPFFAPIVAVVCLGTTYGQRLRRVVEVTVGVALGILIADLFVKVVGGGRLADHGHRGRRDGRGPLPRRRRVPRDPGRPPGDLRRHAAAA